MKKLIPLILLLPTAANCDDAEYQEFLQDINSAQEKIDYSEKLISHDQLHQLIKKKQEATHDEDSLVDRARRKKEELASKPKPATSDTPPDLSPEYSSSESVDDVTKPNKTVTPSAASHNLKPEPVEVKKTEPDPKTKPVKTVPSKQVATHKTDVYISPALRNLGAMNDAGPRISNNATLKAPAERNITYGVTIGTNIDVELDTSATNVQPGYVQFITTEDVIGYKKTLPRRTRFFGQPSAVIGSDKLFVRITSGIDPNTNQEFTLIGNAFDDEGDPGLVAYIVNDGRAIERATDAGTSALGAGVVGLIPSNVATDAAKASADSLLRDKQNGDLVQNGKPRYILQANPQKATIQIERTF